MKGTIKFPWDGIKHTQRNQSTRTDVAKEAFFLIWSGWRLIVVYILKLRITNLWFAHYENDSPRVQSFVVRLTLVNQVHTQDSSSWEEIIIKLLKRLFVISK